MKHCRPFPVQVKCFFFLDAYTKHKKGRNDSKAEFTLDEVCYDIDLLKCTIHERHSNGFRFSQTNQVKPTFHCKQFPYEVSIDTGNKCFSMIVLKVFS